MIKLKDLLKESHVWERKFGEPLPTLASIQKKKLKEEINKLTEKLSKSDIKKMRDKFNKTGKLPPHLKKLADLMDKHKEVEDIVVPGLEWMNDIPEGVVKKGTQQLNERDPVTQADFDEDMGIKVGKIQQLRYSDWGKYIEFNTGMNKVSLQKKELEAIFKIYKKYKSKIK